MDKEKKELLDYIKSQRLMSLATFNKNQVSSCTVYYAIDNNSNLYFVSGSDTEHVSNLKQNPQVACSIFDSNQKVNSKKIGAQIKGQASEVHGLEIVKVLALWNLANPGAEKIINFENIKKKIIESRVFKIKPKSIRFFSEKLYGSEEFEDFDF